MRSFLLKIVAFGFILLLIIIIGALLPATPRTSQSLLFAKVHKDYLLQTVKSPRIIFVGGSNLSFGLDSKKIRDSLKINPINTAVNANNGLVYMMDNTLPYIKSGDIVVVSPEYDHFYGDFAYGREELLRTVLDVNFSQVFKLRKEQWLNIFIYIPRYAVTKFDPTEYGKIVPDESEIYGVHSFNEFGDAYKHWQLKGLAFLPDEAILKNFNYTVVDDLYNFEQKIRERGAVMLITFPGYQATSFEVNKSQIKKVEEELKKKHFILLESPERDKIPDSLMFNTPYHLTKRGVDYRTNLLIEDLKAIHKNTISN